MTSQETLPAVELDIEDDFDTDDPFEIEKRAFWAMRDQLLDQFEGQFVAVYQGCVIDHDSDKIRLGLRAYRQFGYKPIYFQLVTRQLLPVVRIPSPHYLGPH
ncbi:MAG: DUF5678 domain-containing protein [Blastocatellia bacterium]